MTTVLLLRALKKFLHGALEDGVPIGNSLKPVSVYLGSLPKKTKENREDEEYPFIILRPMEGDSDSQGAFAKVKLLFGTQSDDDEGFLDVLNLMERVRILLMRERIVEKQYRIQESWKWTFFDEQPDPQWISQAITTWDIPQIRQEVTGL